MKILLTVLILFVFGCKTIKFLPDGPIYECSNRYEFRHILHDYIKELQNCTFVREKFPPCEEEIMVSISIDEPYTILEANGTVKGLLPGMLQIAVDSCCHGCTKLKYAVVKEEIEKYFSQNAKVIMPHEGAIASSRFIGYDFIPVIEIKAVTFLTKESSRKPVHVEEHLLNSILDTWPLFLTAFMMALIAGCVVWVLDTWFNHEEFPTSFPRGPFEGFWCAFVSMTTVGYGDRAPKSIIARLFAIFWILAGITIFSMYTATLTSALSSQVANSKVESMYGKKIGCLYNTAAGHSAAIKEHAHVKTYHDVHTLIDALERDEVYAIALDDNIASFHLNDINDNITDLIQHHRIAIKGNSYGLLSYDKKFTTFIKTFLESNEDNRNTMLEEIRHEQKLENNRISKTNTQSAVLFTSKSPLFLKSLGILFALGVITVVIGLLCKVFFKRNKTYLERCISCQEYKKKDREGKDVEFTIIGKDSEDLKKHFTQDIDDLKDKWMKVLQNNN